MDYINVVSFENDNVFTDHNTNGPYDNLFPSLRTYLLTDELPEKYILNIATPQLNTDDINFFDFFNSNVKLLVVKEVYGQPEEKDEVSFNTIKP